MRRRSAFDMLRYHVPRSIYEFMAFLCTLSWIMPTTLPIFHKGTGDIITTHCDKRPPELNIQYSSEHQSRVHTFRPGFMINGPEQSANLDIVWDFPLNDLWKINSSIEPLGR